MSENTKKEEIAVGDLKVDDPHLAAKLLDSCSEDLLEVIIGEHDIIWRFSYTQSVSMLTHEYEFTLKEHARGLLISRLFAEKY